MPLTRPLTLLVLLTVAACGDPFSPEPTSNGPGLGGIRVSVDVPGTGTMDDDGFQVTSPFFSLSYPWYGGEMASPGLPEGLQVTVGFSNLAEWCHPSPLSQHVVIRRDDTVNVAFTLTCDALRRPVRFRVSGTPVMITPATVVISMPLNPVISLQTGQSQVANIQVNSYNVVTAFPSRCIRAPTDQTYLVVPLHPRDTVNYDINLQCTEP